MKELVNKVNFDDEFFGTGFGLTGAFLVSMGNSWGFVLFLISNIFLIRMGMGKNLKVFVLLQAVFTITSFIGIYNGFFVEPELCACD